MNKRSLSMLLLTLAIIGVFILYYVGQSYVVRNASSPQVKEGVLDLTEWDVKQDGLVKLSGTWQFYWDQLLEPQQEGELSSYLTVPGQWNKQGFPAKGSATYRLLLKVNPTSEMYGLRISNIQMSSTLFINGVEMGSSGKPALQREDYTPQNRPYTVYFPVEGDTVEILIHAANYDFINGGVTYPIRFGSMEDIQRFDRLRVGFDIVVIVAIGLIGIHHLGIFLKRRQEKSLLYFGLYGLLGAISISFLSDKVFMQIFEKLSFELSYKIQFIGVHGSMIMMILFARTICSDVVPAWLFKIGLSIFSLGLIFSLVVPFQVHAPFTFIFSLTQAIIYILLIWFMTVSKEERYGNLSRQSIIILICAYYAVLIGLYDNSVYILGFVPNNILGNAGLLLFSILVSLLLAFQFSDAYKTIERMSEKLIESDRLKDEFLLHTSHEFQTPLNGILNISQSMLEGAAGKLEEKQKLNLTLIQESARRLSRLVGDILDLERIKRNDMRLELTQVDVKSMTEIVLELFSHIVCSKNIVLINSIADDLPPVVADQYRLRQIITNLVGNAVKFTEQGQIEILSKVTGDSIKITVRDSGIGISPADWANVFEAFNQVENGHSQGYGGMGLGLSISRQLIELMNGKIFIEDSQPGVGTSIAFVLPIAKSATSRNTIAQRLEPFTQLVVQREQEQADRRKTNFTLLAVDDESTNLQILINLFSNVQCRVLVASNGSEALQILKNNPDIDVILLDVMMPKMSGYEVCREIRHQYSLFDLPIVLLTVRNTPQDVAAGFAAGANDFIVKPFNASEVRARVQTLLELKRSVRTALNAEMAFLQSQIKPHFLFNALNAIMSICYSDSERAAELINHLSSYLRGSFDIPSTEMYISIREELKLVESYVEIEKARFDERLEVEYEIDETLLDVRIVPLTIQPIVENSIRHGVMRKRQGGKVKLSVSKVKRELAEATAQDMVCITVWDNGLGIEQQKLTELLDPSGEQERKGVGVSNIHRRLLGLFGEGLHIESVEGEWTSVRFYIKLSKAMED